MTDLLRQVKPAAPVLKVSLCFLHYRSAWLNPVSCRLRAGTAPTLGRATVTSVFCTVSLVLGQKEKNNNLAWKLTCIHSPLCYNLGAVFRCVQMMSPCRHQGCIIESILASTITSVVLIFNFYCFFCVCVCEQRAHERCQKSLRDAQVHNTLIVFLNAIIFRFGETDSWRITLLHIYAYFLLQICCPHIVAHVPVGCFVLFSRNTIYLVSLCSYTVYFFHPGLTNRKRLCNYLDEVSIVY